MRNTICYFIDFFFELLVGIKIRGISVVSILLSFPLLLPSLLLFVSSSGLCLLLLCLLWILSNSFRWIWFRSLTHLLPKLSFELCSICLVKVPIKLSLLSAVKIVHKLLSEVTILPPFFPLISAIVVAILSPTLRWLGILCIPGVGWVRWWRGILQPPLFIIFFLECLVR